MTETQIIEMPPSFPTTMYRKDSSIRIHNREQVIEAWNDGYRRNPQDVGLTHDEMAVLPHDGTKPSDPLGDAIKAANEATENEIARKNIANKQLEAENASLKAELGGMKQGMDELREMMKTMMAQKSNPPQDDGVQEDSKVPPAPLGDSDNPNGGAGPKTATPPRKTVSTSPRPRAK